MEAAARLYSRMRVAAFTGGRPRSANFGHGRQALLVLCDSMIHVSFFPIRVARRLPVWTNVRRSITPDISLNPRPGDAFYSSYEKFSTTWGQYGHTNETAVPNWTLWSVQLSLQTLELWSVPDLSWNPVIYPLLQIFLCLMFRVLDTRINSFFSLQVTCTIVEKCIHLTLNIRCVKTIAIYISIAFNGVRWRKCYNRRIELFLFRQSSTTWNFSNINTNCLYYIMMLSLYSKLTPWNVHVQFKNTLYLYK